MKMEGINLMSNLDRPNFGPHDRLVQSRGSFVSMDHTFGNLIHKGMSTSKGMLQTLQARKILMSFNPNKLGTVATF